MRKQKGESSITVGAADNLGGLLCQTLDSSSRILNDLGRNVKINLNTENVLFFGQNMFIIKYREYAKEENK